MATGQKLFEINEIWEILERGQTMTLTSGTCLSPCTHLVYYVYQVLHHILQYFLSNHPFKHFFIQRHNKPKLTIAYKGQRSTIQNLNLVVFECLILYTKFQWNRPIISEEEDFLRFLLYMYMAAIFVMSPDHLNKLSFPQHMEASYEIWLQLAQRLQRRCLKMLTYDVWRMTEACLYYKLTNELLAQLS